MPNNLSLSNNSLPIQQQQLDSDNQFEQWRILGNVDSVPTSVKGSNSNNSAASSSIPEEIMIMNGNVAKHEGNEKKMFLKFPPNILVNKNCLEL
ncbi:unnamed protein product [Trichobilharzia regenti]|nr:unnamed protein product [Trichobilharzia regenti]